MINKVIGPYRLASEIGVGGMGSIYKAVNLESDETVAVKLLSREYLDDLGLRAAFEREAELVTGLKHDAIVPVYDFGQDAGQPYLVIQFMPNGSLADRLQQGSLTPQELIPILDRLCQAIDYAHEKGVIHRDIKPSNILFDNEDRAYLADFGIARRASSHQAASPIDGTPAYLSPEQALGETEIDGRCDIYALGIVIYESLTGRLPFDGQLPIRVILQQIHNQAPSLRAVDWGLPAALDEVVQRALAKDPAARYPTASDLARAYKSALSTEKSDSDGVPRLHQQADQNEDRSREDLSLVSSEHTKPSEASSPSQLRGKKPSDSPKIRISFSEIAHAPGDVGWRPAHILALGFVTLLGFAMAAGLVAFLQLPKQVMFPSDQSTNIMLEFDRSSLVLINGTSEPLSLTDLSFRRIETGNASPAEFQASRWAPVASDGQAAIQPGGCYLLLLHESADFTIQPGRDLPDPPGCDNLQGWLILPKPESWFWIPSGESVSFEMIINGAVVQTCTIASGNCRFTRPRQ